VSDSAASIPGIPGVPASPSRSPLNVEANDPARFLNRDIEWLEFNARVLDIASDARTPLLERLRFLAIYSANLDEFFMKRVGVLKRQIEAGVSGPSWRRSRRSSSSTASVPASRRSATARRSSSATA
jgi:polyphosphate kinase